VKSLILTGDDFGSSAEVNEAIERRHRAGLLTQASLMVNEPAVDEAVRIARRNPQLCVGLHLTLCAGRASRPSRITNESGRFPDSPALAGLRYAFDPMAAEAVGHEIAEQFARFRHLGFGGTYVDGHTHLHLHPVVLRTLLRPLGEGNFRMLRLVREPGNFTPTGLVFRGLSASAMASIRRLGITAADHVFGLRDTGRMTERRLADLIAALPEGVSEIYSHPGVDPGEFDFSVLGALLDRCGITLSCATTLPPPQTAV